MERLTRIANDELERLAQDTQTEVKFVERNNALHVITDKRLKTLGYDAFKYMELNQ